MEREQQKTPANKCPRAGDAKIGIFVAAAVAVAGLLRRAHVRARI
jgi:hypothetical protein